MQADRAAPLLARNDGHRADALLAIRADSPGLLVRPRWRRLELGCEFLPDQFWQPTLAFAAGAVAAAERHADRSLPPIDVVLAPSTQRFGWYVDRAAFGSGPPRRGAVDAAAVA